MAICEACANGYDKTFQVVHNDKPHIFDSFEFAIHALAPTHIAAFALSVTASIRRAISSAANIVPNGKARAVHATGRDVNWDSRV